MWQQLQRATYYLLRNRWQALGLTFAITFVPVLGLISILFATLVTLRKGMTEGAIFTIAATVPFVLTGVWMGHDAGSFTVLWAEIGIVVVSNLLTWVCAVLLYRSWTWSQILQVAALIAVLMISVVHLVYPEVGDWWGKQFADFQQYVNGTLVKAGMLDNVALSDEQTKVISYGKLIADGLLASIVLVNALLCQLLVARWWQSAVFDDGMLRRELHNIRLSKLAGALGLLSVVCAYMGNTVVVDMILVVTLLFAAAGLSLVHFLFGLMKKPSGLIWLVVLYGGMLLSLASGSADVVVIALEMLALMGFADIWLNMRKRFIKF